MTETSYNALRRAAGDVSRETFERLQLFERRFLEWNRQINLTSASSPPQLWPRHIIDSAQITSLAPTKLRWLDLGSGGGFPGVIVAIMLIGTAGAQVHLVESNRKKAAFLARIVAETGATAVVHAKRIEELHDNLHDTEIVTARALASLERLLGLAAPWLVKGAHGLFQKGRDYRLELEQCRDDWTFDLIEHASKTDPGGVILEISKLHSRNNTKPHTNNPELS